MFVRCKCGLLAKLIHTKFGLEWAWRDFFEPFRDLSRGKNCFVTSKREVKEHEARTGTKLLTDEECAQESVKYKARVKEQNRKMHEKELEFYAEKLSRGETVLDNHGYLIPPERR